MREMGTKQKIRFYKLLVIIMGIIILIYSQKIGYIRRMANSDFTGGVQLMAQAIEELDKNGDESWRIVIAEGYGMTDASFRNSKYRKNEKLSYCLYYLNNMMTNRNNISEIIEQNDFSAIVKDLRSIWKYGKEESFARSFDKNIREHTKTR